MERVLKFRAWDSRAKVGKGKMVYMDPYSSDTWCHGTLKDLVSEEEWQVMQFTGLLDRNDKEIWEGDILNVPYNNIGNQEVKFLAGEFNCTDYNYSRCAVVGNVFENPELVTP